MKSKIALFSILVCGRLCAGPLDDKTSDYFVDQYGSAKVTTTATSTTLFSPSAGEVVVPGSFALQEYSYDDLRVAVVFFQPSAKIAAVRVSFKKTWTPQQLEAFLGLYGGEWKRLNRKSKNQWVAPDGSMAVQRPDFVSVLSKDAVDLIDRTVAEAEGKKQALQKI